MEMSDSSITSDTSKSTHIETNSTSNFFKGFDKFENNVDEIIKTNEIDVEKEMSKLTDNLHVNMEDGSRFLGKLINEKRQGIGQNLFQNGITYRGFFKDDMMEGQGILIKNSRAIFQGNFIENKFDGFGKRVYDNGDIYKGQFKNGARHGTGIYHFVNGDKYCGNFDKHKKSGKGKV